MRKVLILSLFALLTGMLSAQQTTRTDTKSSSRPAAQARGNQTVTATSRSQEQPAVTRQTTTVNPTARPSKPHTSTAATERSATPRTNISRSPLNNSSKTTAKAAPSTARNAKVLKPAEPVKVNWMTLDEALEKSKTEKRKILVDVYTDWCGWCKRMEDSTFTDPEVARYLNDNYYAVKFNAEQMQDINFKGKTYKFKRNGSRGFHELAAEWMNNRQSYPTTVFLDENQNVIQPLPGYLDANKMDAILNYFGTNSHKTTPWETYERKFSNQR